MLRKLRFSRIKKIKPIMRGQRLAYNAAVQSRYVSALLTLTKKMIEETTVEIKRVFKSPASQDFYDAQYRIAAMDEGLSSKAKKILNELFKKWNSIFTTKSKQLAQKMIEDSLKASDKGLKRSLSALSGGLSIKTNFISAGLEEVVKAVVAENVSLIKSIPQKYLNDVNGIVMRSITTGAGMYDLMPELDKLLDQKSKQIKNKAKNLALDQTRKAYNGVNRQRMMSVGVKKFEWIHSGGGQHPRQMHIDMSGNIYSFDDPPEIDENGTRGYPGDAPNCGCTMTPIIEFDEEDE